jgi:hypothetical protein
MGKVLLREYYALCEGGEPMGIGGLARTGLASLSEPQDQPLHKFKHFYKSR